MVEVTEQSLVSVYMATHNRLWMLKKAISSVLNQSYKSIELIIVNDCSSDGTYEYLNSISSANIKVLHNEEVKGACFSRNIAIKNARGKYITGLDDDDLFCESRVETLLHYYQPIYSFVYADDMIINGQTGKVYLRPKKRGFVLSAFMRWNIVGNQIFTETYKLQACLYDEELPSAQDYDCFMRLVESYGNPLKVNRILQSVNVCLGIDTVSSGRKVVSGYFMFYKKHKSKMVKPQRKYQLMTILIRRRKKITLRTLMVLSDWITLRHLVVFYYKFSIMRRINR